MGSTGGDAGDPLGPGDDPDRRDEVPDRSTEFERDDSPGWPAGPGSIEERLFARGHRFNFFQAVRLLRFLRPDHAPVGCDAIPRHESVWFRSHQSLSFPASAVQAIRRPDHPGDPPVLVQNFLGLTGPSGVLPIHYSEMMLHLRRTADPIGDTALRDWLDLFNHRLTSFFYRTWEKYRPFPPFERGEYHRPEPDSFTQALLSVVGLGLPALRNRLHAPAHGPAQPSRPPGSSECRIDDLTLLYYGGLLAQRPPNAAGLEQLLAGFLRTRVVVEQFQGQWLCLDDEQQTRLGWDGLGRNNQLGVSSIAGSVVWDVKGKFRIRLGPLTLDRFAELLPIDEPESTAHRAMFLLYRLVRLYAGPELEFDVQLVLRGDEVTECQLVPEDPIGARLGWNTWLINEPLTRDADDPSFRDDFPRNY
jgi:type VI secretion system protein ImpH